LSDVESIIEITQGVQLPLFTLHSNVVLLDTFQSELFLLHKDGRWVSHKLLCDFQSIWRHGGGEQAYLNRRWEGLENVVNLVLESSAEHFISFIKNENLDIIRAQNPS
jgi:hypothetical protein